MTDPFCCNVQWDAICANQANMACVACIAIDCSCYFGRGDCCAWRGDIGPCSDSTCCFLVGA